MEIQGATALVTGASRRIGRGLALALAEKGCNVAVHYHSAESEALKTRDMARESGVKSEAIRADLAIADECERLWERTVEKMGNIPSIIVNNASFFDRVTIANLTSDDFDRAMALNVRAPMLLAQAMCRDLPEDSTGKILNINDRRVAYQSRITYAITNSALTGLTKTLAISLAPRIQSNELRLGIILPFVGAEDRESGSYSNQTIGPAGRMGTIDEVCQAVISIIRNDYINGASLSVDGGLSAID